MAQTNIYLLMPALSYTGLNGSVTASTGEKTAAASYYIARNNLQTVTWSCSTSFSATVSIQATLTENPTESDWFLVQNLDTSTNKSGFINVEGLFVYIRAKVTNWTAGNIHYISLTY